MKKLFAATAIALCFGITSPSMAFEHGDKPSKEEFKKMSAEDKQEFRDKKEEEWQKLPKDEKVKLIEQRRADRIKKMDDNWKGMSDDEKIKFVEERHEKRKERRDDFKDKKDKE